MALDKISGSLPLETHAFIKEKTIVSIMPKLIQDAVACFNLEGSYCGFNRIQVLEIISQHYEPAYTMANPGACGFAVSFETTVMIKHQIANMARSLNVSLSQLVAFVAIVYHLELKPGAYRTENNQIVNGEQFEELKLKKEILQLEKDILILKLKGTL